MNGALYTLGGLGVISGIAYVVLCSYAESMSDAPQNSNTGLYASGGIILGGLVLIGLGYFL